VEFLPLIGIALLFWLFIIRPQSRRQKELRSMQSSLSVGDEVMLTSGVFATVELVEDDHVLVGIAPGVTIKVARGAVGTVLTQVDQPENDPENDPESDLEHDVQQGKNEPGAAAGTEEN
jgi:preprotein translocase subunit YajC